MDRSPNPRVDAMKNSYMLEKEYEENDKHYQNALSLYEMILDNVEQTAESVCRHTDKKEYLESARIGVMKAWIDRLVHKLPDWEIEYMKDMMTVKVD